MSNKKKLYYKGIHVNSIGLPLLNQQENTKNKSGKKKRLYHTSFPSTFKKNSQRNLIVMYDIADQQKKERDWFRRHLIKFGYIMIQKSVWVGPSPLPKDFVSYAKEIKIGDNLRTLKLAKAYDSKIKEI